MLSSATAIRQLTPMSDADERSADAGEAKRPTAAEEKDDGPAVMNGPDDALTF
jgi:hypothetical protein